MSCIWLELIENWNKEMIIWKRKLGNGHSLHCWLALFKILKVVKNKKKKIKKMGKYMTVYT